MTISNVIANKRKSNSIKNARAIEDLVIEICEHHKTEALSAKEKEFNLQKMYKTRLLTRDLFRCTNQEEIDRVVVKADQYSKDILQEFGEDPLLRYRIRNCELQVRELVKTHNLKSVNPDYKPIKVVSNDGVVLVDSWGHLAKWICKGYQVVLD